MWVWIIMGIAASAVVLIMTRAAHSGGAKEIEAAAYDLQVYRDQLKEVDRDLARGVIGAEEAERVRIEVSRRILAADAQIAAGSGQSHQPRGTAGIIAASGAAVVLAGALWLYNDIGTPGFADVPMADRLANSAEMRANRMTQEEAEARVPYTPPQLEVSPEFLNLMERLRATVADRPDDIEGLSLLARNEASLGNMDAAMEAQARIIELRGDDADAADHSYMAELLISAASGYVSQEAEAALREALRLDSRYPFARYYLAQYLMQVDRPDAAFRTLEMLLEESTEDAPWVMPIRQQIEEVAWRAGVNYELPPLSRMSGPSAEEIAAAEDMNPEDRIAMIESMVAGLSDRLATDGGPVEDWARLIRALGVLDDKDQAQEIFTEARQVFADDLNAQRLLRLAAQDAEIAQ